MDSREKIKNIFKKSNTGTNGLWLGSPAPETVEIYGQQLNIKDKYELADWFGDDCRWLCPEFGGRCYRHPEGRPMWDYTGGKVKKSLCEAGVFADCTKVRQVEEFPWPDPGYLDFSEVKTQMYRYQDKAVFSGMWCPFFHVVSDFFGMENYFIKMYTDPEVVLAVTEHVVSFYLAANEKFFLETEGLFDTFFFGNDLGTQKDLLVGESLYQKYILPFMQKLIQQAKDHGKIVMLHSCGSIIRIVPSLIDAGIDAIHPLQAKAAGMDAANLAAHFKDKVAFVGGVDTQDLLVNASASEIRKEVFRLRETLGPHYIVSPSHEAVLPDVPLDNLKAMADASKESYERI